MNSCVLMAEITKAPELRYTQDGQTAISEMWVQFPPLRSGDPMETLKVIGWGNLAQQIQDQFQIGDQVIIEGRLGMITIDRPEGFKEKQAELTVSRIHATDLTMTASPTMASETSSASPPPAAAPVTPAPQAPGPQSSVPQAPGPQTSGPQTPGPQAEPNYDDIPF